MIGNLTQDMISHWNLPQKVKLKGVNIDWDSFWRNKMLSKQAKSNISEF